MREATSLKNIKYSTTTELYKLKRRKKVLLLLKVLAAHPGGISTNDLSEQTQGEIRDSLRTDILRDARLSATRKQLQRANQFLAEFTCGAGIVYCRNRKIWQLRDVI